MAKSELDLTEEAMEDFKKVLNINPNHVAALLQMSYSLCSLKRYEEGLTCLDKVIEINPDWYSYMKRAGLRETLGDLEGAKMDEDTAWEMGHDFPY